MTDSPYTVIQTHHAVTIEGITEYIPTGQYLVEYWVNEFYGVPVGDLVDNQTLAARLIDEHKQMFATLTAEQRDSWVRNQAEKYDV